MHYLECRALLLAGLVCLLPMAAAHGYEAYISNEKDNTVSVVDLDKMAVVRTYQVGQRPRGITMTKDGQFILLCASDDDTVQVIEAKTGKIVKTLTSGPDPELFILHPSGNPLYIANEDDNLVTVVDVETDKVLAEIPVGVEPEGMGISPDGSVMVNTS